MAFALGAAAGTALGLLLATEKESIIQEKFADEIKNIFEEAKEKFASKK